MITDGPLPFTRSKAPTASEVTVPTDQDDLDTIILTLHELTNAVDLDDNMVIKNSDTMMTAVGNIERYQCAFCNDEFSVATDICFDRQPDSIKNYAVADNYLVLNSHATEDQINHNANIVVALSYMGFSMQEIADFHGVGAQSTRRVIGKAYE